MLGFMFAYKLKAVIEFWGFFLFTLFSKVLEHRFSVYLEPKFQFDSIFTTCFIVNSSI